MKASPESWFNDKYNVRKRELPLLLTKKLCVMVIAVLEVGDGVFEVLSTAGDTHLGGDDFDKVCGGWLGIESYILARTMSRF